MPRVPRIRFRVFVTVGTLFIALTTATISARADEMVQNLGPVGPYEPILTTVGNKRLIAFYLPDSGRCAVHGVIWNSLDPESLIAKSWPSLVSASRIRVELDSGRIAHIDADESTSISLQCGDRAATLAIVGIDDDRAFGIARSAAKHKSL